MGRDFRGILTGLRILADVWENPTSSGRLSQTCGKTPQVLGVGERLRNVREESLDFRFKSLGGCTRKITL